ncbi:TPR-like protein [Hesseltinella vesiculosa]|uniref:TPR-like protein n=1 Tax=Hesseltinella vesiculosa TaxID=101127 RepID=A0A1X2GLR2_9FUNG|nr:TPR-like protein [Hesseltinella vesiculosa]
MTPTVLQKLASANEHAWLTLGNVAELMFEWDKATTAYKSALRHNPYSLQALRQIANVCRAREEFEQAIDYFQRVLSLQNRDGDTWGALGHCYLMTNDLQQAYHAYQQALYHLPDVKDPKLWYGIGILYDRYGSLEHAEEAFVAAIKMDPNFEKINEVHFRLGIIYKQQEKYDQSLQCFEYILEHPPKPLKKVDILFQQGHVYEQRKEFAKAKELYERVLEINADDAKVLQQLGWLYHQPNTDFADPKKAVDYFMRSLHADDKDPHTWYFLGRSYMVEKDHAKAYESYQKAVYLDANNPIFWCSIGVLYFHTNQFRDALDAYSRALRLSPHISEIWYNLGILYESCNNQTQDAVDAYQKAIDLDPKNAQLRDHIHLLQSSQSPITTPLPIEVDNPYQYPTQELADASEQKPSPPMLKPTNKKP